MSKRYWVKLTLEVNAYDEETQRILPSPAFTFRPATNLTPEPEKYVRETLADMSVGITKVLVDLEQPKPEATNVSE